MKIRIKNLRLRTTIGIYEWERKVKQDVVINVEIEFDGEQASQMDHIQYTLDYKKITKSIIQLVEKSDFFLLEKLGDEILKICVQNPLVQKAKVEVDKPQALRYADSVSIEKIWEKPL